MEWFIFNYSLYCFSCVMENLYYVFMFQPDSLTPLPVFNQMWSISTFLPCKQNKTCASTDGWVKTWWFRFFSMQCSFLSHLQMFSSPSSGCTKLSATISCSEQTCTRHTVWTVLIYCNKLLKSVLWRNSVELHIYCWILR